MKIICDRAALLEAVNVVAAVVPQRSPSPALSCVKLTAGKNGNVGELTLAGTDAETSVQLTIHQVDVSQTGVAIVPAHKLQQIVGGLDQSDPTVTLELDGEQCSIKGANSRFKVFTYPAADYPPLPDFAAVVGGSAPQPARAVFTHQAGPLLRLIARTVFATARETSRYAINGVLMKRDGKRLEMVATDGRRLARCATSVKADAAAKEAGPTQCIVPTKALNLLQRLAGDPDGALQVAITDNRVFFGIHHPAMAEGKGKKGGGGGGGGAEGAVGPLKAVLSSALVEGQFPPFEDVIPKDSDKKITATTEGLSRAVRQAAVLTNEESRGVKMAFSSKAKKVRLSSRAPEMGESEVDCDLSEYVGDDIEISFNPQFITEALKAVDEPEVTLEMKAPNKPGLLRAGSDFLYVVMPVNLPA